MSIIPRHCSIFHPDVNSFLSALSSKSSRTQFISRPGQRCSRNTRREKLFKDGGYEGGTVYISRFKPDCRTSEWTRLSRNSCRGTHCRSTWPTSQCPAIYWLPFKTLLIWFLSKNLIQNINDLLYPPPSSDYPIVQSLPLPASCSSLLSSHFPEFLLAHSFPSAVDWRFPNGLSLSIPIYIYIECPTFVSPAAVCQ